VLLFRGIIAEHILQSKRRERKRERERERERKRERERERERGIRLSSISEI
jgi:hypothetical protein